MTQKMNPDLMQRMKKRRRDLGEKVTDDDEDEDDDLHQKKPKSPSKESMFTFSLYVC